MARQIDPAGPEERNVVYDDGPRDRTRYYGYYYYSPFARLVWTLFGIISVILALRFVLRVIGASASAPFTAFIYNISAPLVRPFSGTVANSASGTGIIEWATVLAFVVYWLVAWILARLASPIRPAMR